MVVEGLTGPTQLVIGDDGDWLVAQLAGGENDGTGQVVRLDPDALDAPPEVILDGLDKPTGVALFAGELWVMERDRLTRGPLDGAVDGADRIVVADDLPTNGRSEGTLTVDGDRLLYDTSGRLDADGTPTAGSGTLFAVTT
ncbi:MAG: glucose sorbosone dehydrogenase, partial [Acidimicrobiia bacterium]|nr:glucose sorbosone dehydrogenase [Acidimicrobiia bacterium]